MRLPKPGRTSAAKARPSSGRARPCRCCRASSATSASRRILLAPERSETGFAEARPAFLRAIVALRRPRASRILHRSPARRRGESPLGRSAQLGLRLRVGPPRRSPLHLPAETGPARHSMAARSPEQPWSVLQRQSDTRSWALQPSDGAGLEIDEGQDLLLLRLDAEATDDSVRRGRLLADEEIAEHRSCRSADRRRAPRRFLNSALVAARYYRVLRVSSGRTADHLLERSRVRDRSMEAPKHHCCREMQPPLPNAMQVQLVWGAGVATTSGIATRQAQQLAFKVRPRRSRRSSPVRAPSHAQAARRYSRSTVTFHLAGSARAGACRAPARFRERRARRVRGRRSELEGGRVDHVQRPLSGWSQRLAGTASESARRRGAPACGNAALSARRPHRRVPLRS